MGVFNFLKPKTKPAMGAPEANEQVRDVLRSMGDDGSSVRHVVHYAYPGKRADPGARAAMAVELKTRGFDVLDAVNGGGFVLEHHRSVSPGDFDAFTQELSGWFTARGWDYDGWECAVAEEPGGKTVH